MGIGTTTPTQGTLQIAAPDQSIKSAGAIRQSNRVEYGFDFALDPYVNGMGYLYGTSGNGRTALEQFDRINNFVGVGITAPQAKFQVSDMAKVYNTVNNEYDSNVEIQGLFQERRLDKDLPLDLLICQRGVERHRLRSAEPTHPGYSNSSWRGAVELCLEL